MAKQLAFNQIFWNCRTTDINQRLVGPWTQMVYHSGDKFFSRTVFTDDQYPGVCRGSLCYIHFQFQRLGTVAVDGIFLNCFFAQIFIFLFKTPEIEGIVNCHNYFVD